MIIEISMLIVVLALTINCALLYLRMRDAERLAKGWEEEARKLLVVVEAQIEALQKKKP